MEELITKKQIMLQALATYKEALDIMNNPKYQEIYTTTRDSAIQRFEYTIDTFWKFLKRYMQVYLNILIEVNNPRAILREAFTNKLMDSEELDMLTEAFADRNLTSHSYKEEIACKLASHLSTYYDIMSAIIKRAEL